MSAALCRLRRHVFGLSTLACSVNRVSCGKTVVKINFHISHCLIDFSVLRDCLSRGWFCRCGCFSVVQVLVLRFVRENEAGAGLSVVTRTVGCKSCVLSKVTAVAGLCVVPPQHCFQLVKSLHCIQSNSFSILWVNYCGGGCAPPAPTLLK